MENIDAIKAALAVKNWEQGNFRYFYFTSPYGERTLNGCINCEFSEITQINPEYLSQIKNSLNQLDMKAHEFLQVKFPDADAGELELSDLVIYPNGSFELGYFTGVTPVGSMYMYTGFESDFSIKPDVRYEAF